MATTISHLQIAFILTTLTHFAFSAPVISLAAHPKFNSSYHDVAAQVVKDRYLSLNVSHLKTFQDFVTDLGITFDTQIKELLKVNVAPKTTEELQALIKDKLNSGELTQADVSCFSTLIWSILYG